MYLGNTRGIFDMEHRNFGRNDPRFWGGLMITPGLIADWTIRELAMYDLPALVEHVRKETGYDKVSTYTAALKPDRLHRSLSRKWSRLHLPLTRHVSFSR